MNPCTLASFTQQTQLAIVAGLTVVGIAAMFAAIRLGEVLISAISALAAVFAPKEKERVRK